MLRNVASILAYLLVGLPLVWLLVHVTRGYPLWSQVSVLGALVLGMIDGRRRRLARKRDTFRDFVD